jgi:hypothetical protein
MKAKILLFGAATLIAAPTVASAQTAPAPGQGQYNGQGYNHMNGPSTPTSQPNQDCEDLIASGAGSDPGNSASSGSSAFGGSAGDVYAGSQTQNMRNTASVSQYDVACSKQPM